MAVRPSPGALAFPLLPLLLLLLVHVYSVRPLPTPVDGPQPELPPINFEDPRWHVSDRLLAPDQATAVMQHLRHEWTQLSADRVLSGKETELIDAYFDCAYEQCSTLAHNKGFVPIAFNRMVYRRLAIRPQPPSDGTLLLLDSEAPRALGANDIGDGSSTDTPSAGLSFDVGAPLAKMRDMVAYARSPAGARAIFRQIAASANAGASVSSFGPGSAPALAPAAFAWRLGRPH